MSAEIEKINFSGRFEGDLHTLPSLLDILENPPGGDSRLDMEDTIDDFQL